MNAESVVASLSSTTFCGRRFSRAQIHQIIETVEMFQNLTRRELAHTICEHFEWCTPTGSLKINSALGLLEKFEAKGLCSPPKLEARRPRVLAAAKAAVPLKIASKIECTLESTGPISLKLVEGSEDGKRFAKGLSKNNISFFHQIFRRGLMV